MNLTGVLPLLAADPAVQQVIERARSTVREPLDVLVALGARPPLVAALTAARTTVPTAAEPPGRLGGGRNRRPGSGERRHQGRTSTERDEDVQRLPDRRPGALDHLLNRRVGG